jgi:hypothetical protein
MSRRAALRSYLTEVARDLVARGIVRRDRGQSLDALLRAEALTVLHEVQDDLTAIGAELGLSLAVAVKQLVERFALQLLTGKAK